MPNRREFLQTGAAVSAIAANGVIVCGAEAVGTQPPVAVARAIYDDRYVEGRRFAAVASAHGVATRALDYGDVTAFWYEELEAVLRRGASAVAGFTQFGPMFVVERLAAERGMRLALRVEHRGAADGTLTHAFSAPRETLELAQRFEGLRADWPGLMATLACRVGGDDSASCTGEIATPSLEVPRLPPSSVRLPPLVHYYTPQAEQQGYGAALDGPLYSWVVAPRAQRG
jgi:hypothetical protein